jgi:class 3 adenylate cyclase
MNTLLSKMKELRDTGISPQILERIEEYIERTDPPKLIQMSPFRLAQEWDTPSYETMDAFLYGTRLGIFDLEWDIKCPSCKGSTSVTGSLALLRSVSHCPYCKIDISGGFDDAVEVTFRVNENIRHLGDIPQNVIIGSKVVMEPGVDFHANPGETAEMEIELIRGTYHMYDDRFSIGAPLLIRGESKTTTDTVVFTYNGSELSRGTEFYGPGKFIIRLTNNSSLPIALHFGRAAEFPWVSGAVVATSQVFRDLFSTELISSDENFSIKNVSFLFTDIKGSTAMYERLGDSRAYFLVKEHFKIMRDVIARHHGSIVKTIGDAVMATFLVSADAVEAVYDIYESFEMFNAGNLNRDDIIIKSGIHRGPCIAVTSNDKLDYFGQTVNIAARVQGLSTGGEIVLSGKVFHEADSMEIISRSGWRYVERKAELKGIANLYDVVYLYPAK